MVLCCIRWRKTRPAAQKNYSGTIRNGRKLD
jgi:hypothetical protein